MEHSLLDTDMFSEALRGRDPAIRAKAEAYLDVFGRFTFSVITVAELVDGFRRQQRDDRIATLITEIEAGKHEVIALGLRAAEIAGYIFGDLHRTGQPIGRDDPFIAATALAEDVPLITGNIEHYQQIQALGRPRCEITMKKLGYFINDRFHVTLTDAGNARWWASVEDGKIRSVGSY